MKMEKTSPWRILTSLLTISIMVRPSQSQAPAGIEHLSMCIRKAEPLVQNPDFIFPLTTQDISNVCRMWDDFVDCVYEYTTTYLTDSQRKDFNKAIETSIQSIHQLCVEDPDYQRMYMAYAPCIRRVSTELLFCGNQYRYLADLVQTSAANDGMLCCAHQKFRNCVLDTTPTECDAGGVPIGSGNSASKFMKDMLDRALGFLLQKCRESNYSSDDCPMGNAYFSEENDLDSNGATPGLQTTRQTPSNAIRPNGSSQSVDSITPNSIIPSLNLAGNNLLGGGSGAAEKQQFRGAATALSLAPILGSLVLVLTIVIQLR